METDSYAPLASEYYDEEKHPTCANFRELSKLALGRFLDDRKLSDVTVLEVGAGRSIVLEFMRAGLLRAKKVIVSDVSESMLSHSRSLSVEGVHFRVCSAVATGLPSDSVDFLVSSLGDPYNTASFWQEAERLLMPGGLCFFTTPAFAWAHQFRACAQGGSMSVADFITSAGTKVSPPSYVLLESEQIELASEANLKYLQHSSWFASALTGSLSPKLATARQSQLPVVTSYLFEKKANQ